MKRTFNFYFLTIILLTSGFAFAGNGDIGSVGDAAPSSVTSTSNLIKQYSPQGSSLTIAKLCEIFESPDLVWGKSKLTCIQRPYGIIEIRGYTAYGTLSVYANATDRTIFEAFGTDDVQQYQNNLQQSFNIHFEWVHDGTTNGVQIGHYKVDALLTSKGEHLRVGLYDRLQ